MRSALGPVFILGSISPDAPAGLEQRLLDQLAVPLESEVRRATASLRANPVQLALDRSPAKAFRPAEQRLLDQRLACAERRLAAAVPLQPGEVEMAPLQAGLLSAPWCHLPIGTPVVSRKTNFCTVHAAFPKFELVGNQIVDQSRPQPIAALSNNNCWGWDLPVQTDPSTAYMFDVAQVIGVIPEFGAMLTPFLSIAQTAYSTNIDMNDVMQTASCAATAISKQTDVTLLQGSISAMYKQITDTYLPAKQAIASCATPAERALAMQNAYTWAASIITALSDNLGALSADNLGIEAAVAYVAGASAVIGLYQDIASVDNTVTDPADSPMFTAMQKFASDACSVLNGLVAELMADREASIAVIDINEPITSCSGGIDPTCIQTGTRLDGAYWVDYVLGTQSENYTSSTDSEVAGEVQACTDAMIAYRTGVLNTLQAQLQPLVDTANAFAIAKPPLPIPTMNFVNGSWIGWFAVSSTIGASYQIADTINNAQTMVVSQMVGGGAGSQNIGWDVAPVVGDLLYALPNGVSDTTTPLPAGFTTLQVNHVPEGNDFISYA